MSLDEEKNGALSLGLLVFSYPAYGDVGLLIFFLYQPFGGISYLIFYAFLGFQVIVLQLPLLCRSSGVMHNRPILHLCLVFEHIELRRLWPCSDLVDENDEVPIFYQTLGFYPYVGVHLLSGHAVPLESSVGGNVQNRHIQLFKIVS